MPVVLDASAVIAVFRGEPVSTALLTEINEGPLMSVVNLGEVAAWLAREGDADLIPAIADAVHVAVVPLLEEQALRAGEIEPVTRPHGLSLADRCCLVTAEAFGAKVYTTDRAWLDLPAPWRERVVLARPS